MRKQKKRRGSSISAPRASRWRGGSPKSSKFSVLCAVGALGHVQGAVTDRLVARQTRDARFTAAIWARGGGVARVAHIGASGDVFHRGSLVIHAAVGDITCSVGIVLVVRDDRVTRRGLAIAVSPARLLRVPIVGALLCGVTARIARRHVWSRGVGLYVEAAKCQKEGKRAHAHQQGGLQRRKSEHIEAPHLCAVQRWSVGPPPTTCRVRNRLRLR